MTRLTDLLRRGGTQIRAAGRGLGQFAQRRPVRIVGILVAGAVGGLIALALAPPVEGDVGPGRVQIQGRSAFDGRTEIGVPPLGSIAAKTHRAPLLVNADVESVDLTRLQEMLVGDRPTRQLTAEAEDDLGVLVRRWALFSVGAGVVGGAVAGLIASHLRWRRVALSATGGLVAVTALIGLAWRDFDANAMGEPTYTGAVERAPSVIDTVSRHVDSVDTIRTRVEHLGHEFAELYALAFASPSGTATPETTILHVSDIHSNPLAMEVVVEIATHFGVDAVLDTGDLTSFGLEAEARITDQIRALRVPYLLVPGNHDSEFNRSAVGRTPNVEVLRNDVFEVNELRILGVEDPTFTATNEIDTAEANEIVLAEAPEIAESVREWRPDVLAVHNERHAAESFGEVPLILNGHGHARQKAEKDGTIRLEVGSTGAHGLESFMVEMSAPFEAQLLHFAGPCLRFQDYLSVHGIGGDVEIERRSFRLAPGFDGDRPTCEPIEPAERDARDE